MSFSALILLMIVIIILLPGAQEFIDRGAAQFGLSGLPTYSVGTVAIIVAAMIAYLIKRVA